jgi:hypothetical protein
MSKSKKTPKPPPQFKSSAPPDAGKRRLLWLGLGGAGIAAAGGLVYLANQPDETPVTRANVTATPAAPFKPLPPVKLEASAVNALRAGEDILSHYARELMTASALIHAVRGFGKGFKLSDGALAVDHLCTQYAEERTATGQRYVAFQRAAEVHENSFLKTFLEAGVAPEQTIRVGQTQYTLKQLGEHAQALFRCDTNNWGKYDPKYLEDHLPWGLIAFSWLRKPDQAVWTNAYGEQIDLHHVFDRALASYDHTCSGLREGLAQGTAEPMAFRQAITKLSCYGTHAVYGFFSCYRQGYRRNDIPRRMAELLDMTILRMEGDAKALASEADAVRGMGPDFVNRMAFGQEGRPTTQGPPPPQIIDVMSTKQQIQMLGHILETVNYGRLHKLFTLNAEQQRRLKAGEQALYEQLVKLRAYDLDAYRRWHSKFVNDIVIAVGHAVRALKLLTPQNPDESPVIA